MKETRSKRKKYISYGLRFLVAGLALYWAFREANFSELGEKIPKLNLKIVAVALFFWLVSQLVFVSRWLLLLKVQSIHIGYWPAFRLHMLGVFYNNCLPGGVGGDFLRAGYVTAHTDKKVEAALSVFVDRIVGLSGMIIMAFVCYRLIPKSVSGIKYEFNLFEKLSEYKWYFACVFGFLVLALVVFALIPKGRILLKKYISLACFHGLAVWHKVHKAMLVYYNRKLAIAFSFVLTFLCQSILIVGLWLVGRNLGIDAHWKYYFVFFPIIWVIGALPISVGALGVWEGLLVILFCQLGEKTSDAQALAVFHRFLWLLGAVPGVIIHLAGAHLPKDFSVDYDGDVT